MHRFAPVTDDDIVRAHSDRAFRQRRLEQNLEALPTGMKKLGRADPSGSAHAGQLRESVELAVRLAEIIQDAGGRSHF